MLLRKPDENKNDNEIRNYPGKAEEKRKSHSVLLKNVSLRKPVDQLQIVGGQRRMIEHWTERKPPCSSSVSPFEAMITEGVCENIEAYRVVSPDCVVGDSQFEN